jgi:hypothetical protein
MDLQLNYGDPEDRGRLRIDVNYIVDGEYKSVEIDFYRAVSWVCGKDNYADFLRYFREQAEEYEQYLREKEQEEDSI